MPHPIERLRYVARTTGAEAATLVRESASALAGVVAVEPAGVVPACRRLVDRHLTTGPMWWLTARVLAAADPVAAARAAGAEIDADPTAEALAAALPDDATLTVVGWPDIIGATLRRRGDAEVLVVDAGGEGSILARRLGGAGMVAASVPDSGVAAAVVVSDLVVVEATAAGPDGILATPGSHAAAAVAWHRGVPVWAVTGVGCVLPRRLWDELLSRLDRDTAEPWDRPVEPVPDTLLTWVVGPSGVVAVEAGLAVATCVAAPELLRPPLG